jgi:gluconate 2-dehydrogenase gamma chain
MLGELMMFDHDLMNRRSMMARVALLLGATSIPAEAFAAQAKRAGSARFLAPAQLALLIAVADTIIPKTDTLGAVGAGIPAKLDRMLVAWASAATRKQVVDALTRINVASLSAQKKGFAALTKPQRDTVLTAHDAAALKPVAPPPGAPKATFFTPISYVVDPSYLKLKDLIISLYYSSEVAMTQELIYEHNPGTWQPSIKVTDKTRPWGSVGPF